MKSLVFRLDELLVMFSKLFNNVRLKYVVGVTSSLVCAAVAPLDLPAAGFLTEGLFFRGSGKVNSTACWFIYKGVI